MANGNFDSTVDSLFDGIDRVISSKTVVGEAIHIDDVIILPLIDVSFGLGAGAFGADKEEKGAGGLGGKMSPSAVIVIQNGRTRLVNIRNQDTMTKILDLIPEMADRFRGCKDKKEARKNAEACDSPDEGQAEDDTASDET